MCQRRSLRLVALFICVMSFALTKPLVVSPPSAEAALNPCSFIPDPLMRQACNATGGAINAIPGLPDPTKVIGNVAGDAANAIARPIIFQLAKLEVDEMADSFKKQRDYILANSSPQITAGWFLKLFGVMLGCGLVLALAMLIWRFLEATGNSDPLEAGRGLAAFAVFIYVGASLPFLVGGLLFVCDHKIAPGIMDLAGNGFKSRLNHLSIDFNKQLGAVQAVGAIIGPALAAFAGLIGGLIIKVMLEVRNAFVYFNTAAEVLALAMWVGGRWSGDLLIKTTFSLLGWILMTVILATVSWIGVELVNAPNLEPILLGAIILTITPIATWIAVKKIARHNFHVSSNAETALRLARMMRSPV